MSIEAFVSILVAILGLFGAFAWWAIRQAVKVGEQNALLKNVEQNAKDETRKSIHEMKPAILEVLAETKEQSKTLAVLVYQGEAHGKRLDAVEVRLDEHGNRISVLEAAKENA